MGVSGRKRPCAVLEIRGARSRLFEVCGRSDAGTVAEVGRSARAQTHKWGYAGIRDRPKRKGSPARSLSDL